MRLRKVHARFQGAAEPCDRDARSFARPLDVTQAIADLRVARETTSARVRRSAPPPPARHAHASPGPPPGARAVRAVASGRVHRPSCAPRRCAPFAAAARSTRAAHLRGPGARRESFDTPVRRRAAGRSDGRHRPGEAPGRSLAWRRMGSSDCGGHDRLACGHGRHFGRKRRLPCPRPSASALHAGLPHAGRGSSWWRCTCCRPWAYCRDAYG